jgi:SAM-dependent methyltransferase
MSRRFRCVGVDVSEEAIALARGRFPDVRFISGCAPRALGGLAADADLFLLTDVLEHIEDDRRFLAGLVAAARPGAGFLVTVPADPRLWTEHDVSFGHRRRYVPRTLRAVWAGLPVAEVALDGLNTRLAPMVRAVRWSNRRLGRTSGRAGTDFEMPPDPVNAALIRLFAGESGRLLRALRAGRRRDRTRGVSLLAVLRRLPDPPCQHAGA